MLKKLTKQFCQLLVNKRGERRNSHAEKGDCVADERKRINERPSGLVTLKPHKRSDLITLKPHLITLHSLLKHFSPVEELFYAFHAEFFKALSCLFYGAYAFKMALGVEFVCVANDLFL